MTTATRPSYSRPRVGWIKRRARRFMAAYEMTRRDAVALAERDFKAFVRPAARDSGLKAWLAVQAEAEKGRLS